MSIFLTFFFDYLNVNIIFKILNTLILNNMMYQRYIVVYSNHIY